MALTQEFVNAVSTNNILKVKIMLKDSLLVDTSFRQFDEMLRYAERRLNNFWVSDEEDGENLSYKIEYLDEILVGLVNNFSRKRVSHLKYMIQKAYPPKIEKNNISSKSRKYISYHNIENIKRQYNEIVHSRKEILEIMGDVKKKKRISDKEIEKIRKEAQNILKQCDEIEGK
jgi:hypothetical protein